MARGVTEHDLDSVIAEMERGPRGSGIIGELARFPGHGSARLSWAWREYQAIRKVPVYQRREFDGAEYLAEFDPLLRAFREVSAEEFTELNERLRLK